MARTLASLAGALGWRTDLIRGPDFTPEAADGRSMIVVATQGHDDEDVLERAVAARPAYLGLVGSRRRGATVLGYLADRGVPRDQLDRVRVPAGLDLGRTSHQEIAVAILAELVQLRASGALAGPYERAARHGIRAAGWAGGGPACRAASARHRSGLRDDRVPRTRPARCSTRAPTTTSAVPAAARRSSRTLTPT